MFYQFSLRFWVCLRGEKDSNVCFQPRVPWVYYWVFFFRDMHAVITLIRAYATSEIDFSIVFYLHSGGSGPRDVQWVMSKTNYRLYVNKLNPCFHDKKPSRIKDFFEFTVEGTGALFVSLEQFWNKAFFFFFKNQIHRSLFLLSTQAFFQGKLKITGNMGMAMKLQSLQLQPGKAKLWEAELHVGVSAGAPPTLVLISVAARASVSAL